MDIDFLKFCSSYIESLKKNGGIGSANNFRVVRNSLIDYFKRDGISIKEVHSNMLISYERYLRSERIITRTNQNGTCIPPGNKVYQIEDCITTCVIYVLSSIPQGIFTTMKI
ncbi:MULTISPECIES: phage integrase SAM-like domain-containing protein [Sphingobacterium]|uniref:Phage integrase SAM-like domain-containing protein n=1 Tax=Sphingobacterium populi TaxID=1812824 RepID=A0ABW5U8V6_9SPHI|nr:phage integrase SAM-like domain-containing protein [Sphingobacterium sp. CFCC 11742]